MAKIALLYLIIYTFGLLGAILVDASWGVYVYELIYFVNPGHRWWSNSIPSFSYSFIAVLVIATVFVSTYTRYKENRLSDLPQTKWIIMMVVVFGLVSFVAIHQQEHYKALRQMIKLVVVLMLVYKIIDTPEKINRCLWVFISGSAYLGWEAYRIGRNGMGRVEGIGLIDSPGGNGAAAVMASSAVFLIFYAWQGSKKEKCLAAVAGALVINGLVLINSRGAFLAVVLSCSYFVGNMIFGKLQAGRQRIAAIMIVIAGLSGALYLTDDTFWNRMETLKSVQEDENKSGSKRQHFWWKTFDMLEEHPGGLGAMGFQMLSPYYLDPSQLSLSKPYRAVHSSWFQTLGEMGWPGPVIFIGLLVSCFRLSAKTRRHLFEKDDRRSYFQVLAMESALLSYMVTATFIDIYRTEAFYWLMLFIACGGNIYLIKSQNKEVMDKDVKG